MSSFEKSAAPRGTTACLPFLILSVLWFLTCGGSSGLREDLRPLAPGQEVTREIGPDQRHGYQIDLDQGDFLAVEVVQEGIDVELLLRAPDGRGVVGAKGPPRARGPEILFALVEETGEYVLEIRSDPATRGLYHLVARPRAPSPVDKLRATASKLRWLARESPYREALSTMERVAALWRATGESSLELVTRIEIARRHDDEGHHDLAVAGYEELLDQILVTETRELRPALLHFLGLSHYHRDDYPAAQENWEAALGAARSLGHCLREGVLLNDLGVVFEARGRPWKALGVYDQALAIFTRLQAFEEKANALHNRGFLLNGLGRDKEALDQYREALTLWRKLGDDQRAALTLLETGWTRMWLGNLVEAEKLMLEALNLYGQPESRQNRAVCLERLGTLYFKQGRAAEARDAHLEALAIFEKERRTASVAHTLNNLGRAYRKMGRADKALEAHERALAVFESLEDPSGHAHALSDRARILQGRGELRAARDEIEKALSLLEELRRETRSPGFRSAYMATVHEHFELYIDVLMDLDAEAPEGGWAARALEAAESSRARTLLELVTELGASVQARAVDPRDLAARGELSLKIRTLEAAERAGVARRRPEAEIDALRRKQRRLRLQWERLEGRERLVRETELPRPRSMEEIENALDADTSLLVFALGHRRSFVWLLGPQGLIARELPPEEKIEELILPLIDSLGRPESLVFGLEPLLAGLDRAGAELLGPVFPALTTDRLAVVPDGVLHRLPFGALRLDGRYLIQDFQVVRLPSASVLVSLRERRRERRPPPGFLAVVADPVFQLDDERVAGHPESLATSSPLGDPPAVEHLVRLPESGKEAEAIAGLVPAFCRWPAHGFAANRRAIVEEGRLGDFRILHLATHAVLDDGIPEHSGLVLSRVDAQGRSRDGFVYAFEIAELSLPADLVVLSACRTADGQEVRGEGLVGVSQSFFEAGADRLVASLWEVDDQATRALMVHFYEGLLELRLPPSRALQRAQLLLLESDDWKAPYFWAPFSLLGDWKRLPSTLPVSPCLQE